MSFCLGRQAQLMGKKKILSSLSLHSCQIVNFISIISLPMGDVGNYIAIIASSSLVGGIVGALTNHLLANRRSLNEYRREYSKLLIEKRFKSYEVIEHALNKLLLLHSIPGVGQYNLVYHDVQSYESFHSSIVEANHHSLWLNKETKTYWMNLMGVHDKISEFVFLNPTASVAHFAATHYAEILVLHNKLQALIMTDIQDLYNLKKMV